jgi:AcrR family transcriptional regulator
MAGLREQKKWETRRRISDVATRMFFARGYDKVTVADVAEAANVSRMTVFNYFPRKEDLLLDRAAETMAIISDRVHSRSPGESIVDVLRALQHEWLAIPHPMSGVVERQAPFWTFVQETPALRARAREQRHEARDELEEIMRAEGAPAAEARLAAGFVAAAHDTIFDTGTSRVLADEPLATVRADQSVLIDRVFDAVDRGLRDFSWIRR